MVHAHPGPLSTQRLYRGGLCKHTKNANTGVAAYGGCRTYCTTKACKITAAAAAATLTMVLGNNVSDAQLYPSPGLFKLMHLLFCNQCWECFLCLRPMFSPLIPFTHQGLWSEVIPLTHASCRCQHHYSPRSVIKAFNQGQLQLLEGVEVGDDGAYNQAPHDGDAHSHTDAGNLGTPTTL
eukprot:1136888-Pelagomonas_calceolata.AAC.1